MSESGRAITTAATDEIRESILYGLAMGRCIEVGGFCANCKRGGACYREALDGIAAHNAVVVREEHDWLRRQIEARRDVLKARANDMTLADSVGWPAAHAAQEDEWLLALLGESIQEGSGERDT